jgi:K+-transporting ATPase KdpF subunit
VREAMIALGLILGLSLGGYLFLALLLPEKMS